MGVSRKREKGGKASHRPLAEGMSSKIAGDNSTTCTTSPELYPLKTKLVSASKVSAACQVMQMTVSVHRAVTQGPCAGL